MLIEHLKYRLKKLVPEYHQNKCLLALSGGADSVAMLHAAHKLGLNVIVAHCHFHLRGREADGDAGFCEKLSAELGYAFFIKHFDTKKDADKRGISIQMAARELRYEWFENMAKQEACDYILIAHNQDDVAETMLINQIRGCGIRGLSGIPEKSGDIIRPFLDVSRFEIQYWLEKNGYRWRDDSSNDKTTYLRNKIRHDVLSEMAKIHPDVKAIMYRNAERVQRSLTVFENLLDRIKREIFTEKQDHIIINTQHDAVTMDLLYELLRDYGFNYNQIQDLYSASASGKLVQTKDYQLVSDRDRWIMQATTTIDHEHQYIIKDKKFSIAYPLVLYGDVKDAADFSINPDETVAQLDVDKISMPMVLRHWEKGDRFIPLGMDNFQKLSDFFVNRKLSLHEKQHQWILCAGDDIVWIIGRQIDNRYKVTKQSKNILEIHYADPAT
ncbi:MAG: tRNA lysidine(34) synthetase TilS [Bacteroidota bacterium]|nr:tRNA lysidine(34) synthetase TilS [Bacteroidota bacterium]